MTNEEFWSQLRSLIDPKTTTSVKAISSLFSTATKENLSLLVVLQDDTLQSLSANDLTFAYCADLTKVTKQYINRIRKCKLIQSFLKQSCSIHQQP